jgi:hypothetical protein
MGSSELMMKTVRSRPDGKHFEGTSTPPGGFGFAPASRDIDRGFAMMWDAGVPPMSVGHGDHDLAELGVGLHVPVSPHDLFQRKQAIHHWPEGSGAKARGDERLGAT